MTKKRNTTSDRRGDDSPHRFDIDPEQSPSEAVFAAVASVTDRTPLDLEPLYKSVDPEALDALFSDPTGQPPLTEGYVAFTYAGCEVVIEHDQLCVRPLD